MDQMFDLPTAEIQRRMPKQKPQVRLYAERDPDAQCVACGGLWAIHSDREWTRGCEQWKKRL